MPKRRFPMPPRPAKKEAEGGLDSPEALEHAADAMEYAVSALRDAAALWREAGNDRAGRQLAGLRIMIPLQAANRAIRAVYEKA